MTATQTDLPFEPSGPMSLAERADCWMHTPGGRHVMRDLYAIAAGLERDWRRYGIPVSCKYIWEIERHRIKCVRARLQRRGVKLEKWRNFTLNNTLTAYIARHMMARRPDWAGMFEVRETQE